ncbi:hypothetical protein ZIOFF_007973 [Zingiber officinale]|uniref:Uncharacterized protein n=1 Tax=Zingiber officinale TaxID=94328 RepID=A0A8J5IEQ6_ZINOF|nr:hypothetical protein ZIOFF_007973 [Zingiber officinale]
MVSLCRSAVTVAARCVAALSETLLAKPAPSRRAAATLRRSMAGSVESLMPLHSAIASVRLNASDHGFEEHNREEGRNTAYEEYVDIAISSSFA